MFRSELEILKTLDHPNLIKFYETYQDQRFFHLVMEYCSGGELLERIVHKGHLNEEEANKIMSKALSSVQYLHANHIAHRDLKPENFLFSNRSEEAELKIIDFGLSTKYGESSNSLKTLVGTALYVAPEVLKGHYKEKCDEWSLGVIMFVLLCGNPPFDGLNNNEIFSKVKIGKYVMKEDDWDNISPEAKDLVSKLLEVNSEKRISAAEALNHPWFNLELKSQLTKIQMDAKILKLLRSFKTTSKLRKEALKVMVNFLTDIEIKNLKDTFRYIDKDNSGMISVQELQQVMKEFGYSDTEKDITKMVENIHVEDGELCLNYHEFIAAALDSKVILTKERLWTVFKYFDVNNANFITAGSLKEAFARAGRKFSPNDIQHMIKEVDESKDGKISFEEFVNMMKIEEDDSSINFGPLTTTTENEYMTENIK